MAMTSKEKRHAMEEREAGLSCSSELDEVSGEAIVVQPKKGVGCKMPEENYVGCVKDMIEGKPMAAVCAHREISRSALEIIRKRHSDVIPTRAQQNISKIQDLHEATTDLMMELTKEGKMPRGVLPVQFGIIFDKLAAATGNNVQKHQHLHAFVPQKEVNSMLDGLVAPKEDKKSSHSDEKTHETSPILDVSPNTAQNDPESAKKTEGGRGV